MANPAAPPISASSPPDSQFQSTGMDGTQQHSTNFNSNTNSGPSSFQPNPNANGSTNANTNSNGASNHVYDPFSGATFNPATQGGPSNPEAPDINALFAARREEEQARRDRSLAEFLVMLDGYKPLIPEEVTEYYLQRAGFECSDPRLKRLLSLSAQKFISDLARDAFHYAKLRVNGTTAGRGRPAAVGDRNRVVLTMDDLSLALSEHGVNVKKPDYYI